MASDKKAALKKMVKAGGKGGPGFGPQIATSQPVPSSGGFTVQAPNARYGVSPTGGVPLPSDQAVTTKGPLYAGAGNSPIKGLSQMMQNPYGAKNQAGFAPTVPQANMASPGWGMALRQMLQGRAKQSQAKPAKQKPQAEFKNVMTPNQKVYGIGVGP